MSEQYTVDKMSDRYLAMTDEVSRLRAENDGLKSAIEDNAKLILHIRMEGEKLRAAMHDIYEVYAGSEGFIPQTCPEAYLQERVKEMADIAAKHKRADAIRSDGNDYHIHHTRRRSL